MSAYFPRSSPLNVLVLLARHALEGARDLALLRVGRHFRLGPATKLVLGRSQEENMELEGLRV